MVIHSFHRVARQQRRNGIVPQKAGNGPSVIIGSQETQIYQRFAGSRQEGFILKIQNDENNAAQQDNGRRFHIEIKQKQGQYFLLFLFDSIELLLHHSLQKHPRLLLQRYSDRSV